MEKNHKKWVAGILTGVAVGTVIALLISNNKKDVAEYSNVLLKKGTGLAKKSGRLSSDLKDKFSELVDQLEDRFHSILS